MTTTDKYVRTPCHLTAWTGEPGHCNWCNTPIPPGGRRTVWCRDLCRRQWERNHIWRRARIFARKRAKYRCTRPGCTAAHRDIEINHIDPRNGAGYGPGCHHHQDPHPDSDTGTLVGGLEALCHLHHVEVTNLQRAARAAQTLHTQTHAEPLKQQPSAPAQDEVGNPTERSQRLKQLTEKN